MAISGRNVGMMGGATFLPTSLPNLSLWLRSDLGVTVVGGGDDHVTEWRDQSAGAHHCSQGTAGNRPTRVLSVQNGRPAIRFDGTDDRLDGSLGTGTYIDGTLYVVGKLNSSGLSAAAFDSSPNTSTNNGLMLFHDAANMVHRRVIALQVAYAQSATTPLIWIAIKDDTVTDPGHTALRIFEAATLKATNAPHNGAGNDLPRANYRVGSLFQDVFPWAGDLFELILYEAAHDTNQRASVVAYLQAGWGL